MIDCPNGEIREQLPDYVHDQLAPAVRAKVAAHVAACAACSAELALLRDLRATMRATPAVDVATIVAALPSSSRVHAAPRRPVASRWRHLDWRAAAAIVVLAAGGSASLILADRDRRRDDTSTQARARTGPQQVATTAVTIDAYVSEASTVELEALLDDLESFDGLPAGEPEPPVAPPSDGEEGL